MIAWFKRLLGMEEYKFVGRMVIMLTETNSLTKQKKDVPIMVGFYMTDSGRRSYLIPEIEKKVLDYLKAYSLDYKELVTWQRGGPFPKDFEPIPDTLGPMLTKLVSQRLETGE